MRFFSAEETLTTITPCQAVTALRDALQSFDPANDLHRAGHPVDGGQMLVMPSSTPTATGIKVLTLNERANDVGVPLIQGAYLLFEGSTLTPSAVLDGAALTSLRTPAVSLAGVLDFLTGSSQPLRAVIFGTGPQGQAHLDALADVLAGIRPLEVTFISRTRPHTLEPWAQAGSAEATRAVGDAELIICATSSRQPLLGAADVRRDAVVVALGSHSPDARELASDLMQTGQVIVEDVATAQRECGDVVLAVAEGALSYGELVTMRQVVTGQVELSRERPIIFKTSGMGWEDLVLAEKIAAARGEQTP